MDNTTHKKQTAKKESKPVVNEIHATEPRVEKPSKIIEAKVNYANEKRNMTSISYKDGDNTLSTFIDGIFSGNLDIEYTGKIFDNKNIVRVVQR